MTDRSRLRPDVGIEVGWEDTTAVGGPLGRRLEAHLRAVFAPAFAAVEAGADPAGPSVRALLEEIVRGEAFSSLGTPSFDATGTLTGWVLHDEVLRPDPASTRARTLTFRGDDGATLDVGLTPEHWPPAHDAIASFCWPEGLAREHVDHPDVARLVDALDAHGFLEVRADGPVSTSFGAGATLVGHATVLVRSARAAVVVDPFLPPCSARHPHGYQPFGVDALGPIDAVLLTHAHPDHTDPGTLLRLPRDVPVVVPAVDAETLLAPDLARRVRELGFTDVRPRPWGSTEVFGDLTVRVLPFFGEQPTAGPHALHPDVVMAGNTYVVTAPWGRVACIADGGDDRRGRTVEAARDERDTGGPVDTVFAGFRGWHTSPAELLGSSVGRYFLFVPPDRWGSREDLMHDPAAAVATADAFGARRLVPYADGGAPWFWELGLGPRLGPDGQERPGFDLFPERVQEAARELVGDRLDVVVLRPGEAIDGDGRWRGDPTHVWPWAPADLTPSG